MAVDDNSNSDFQQIGYKPNTIFLFLSGLIVVVLSILVYLLVLKTVFGRFSSSELLPEGKSFFNLVLGNSPEIAILNSEYTKNMLPGESEWLSQNMKTWQNFFNTRDLKFEILTDEAIEKGEHFNYKLIVLPGCKSLSDNEITQIKKFVENGGSIFATGGIASFSDNGKWRGWDFLSEVFGIRYTKEIGSEDKTKIHTLRGGLPLTANIPTGFPLNVATWDKPIAAEVLDPRTIQVSFWYNYRLEDGLVREGIKESAGIVYGNYGKGRFIWLGFEVNSILGLTEDYVFFDRLINNCVNWLTYNPIAYIRNWPYGFSGAAVIAPVLSDSIRNIDNLLPILKALKIPATFLIESYLAELDPYIIKKISEYGEVAALVDQGYLTDQSNSLLDYKKQFDNLKSDKQILERILGKEVTGVFPSPGFLNENTIKAVINSGYKYFLTDSLTDRSIPKTIIREKNRITSITKTARDDYEVIRDFNLKQKEFQFYTYQEDIDRVKFEGGLYLFKLHTEYQCTEENIRVVEDIIKELKNKNFWITTALEVQQWFEKKEYVELRTKKRGNHRVAITITNPGSSVINNLVVDIDLNENAKRITLDAEIIGTKKAAYLHTEGARFVYLYVDELEPEESRTYYVDYDKVDS